MARFKLRPLFSRSKTAFSSASGESNLSSTTTAAHNSPNDETSPHLAKSTSSLHSPEERAQQNQTGSEPAPAAPRPRSQGQKPSPSLTGSQRPDLTSLTSVGEEKEDLDAQHDNVHSLMSQVRPALVLQEATPPTSDNTVPVFASLGKSLLNNESRPQSSGGPSHQEGPGTRHSSTASPKHVSRPHSIVDSANVLPSPAIAKSNMPRKIWVRRPGASATLVQVREDDLVDDVREMILRKYANSLGRTFDAPDMTLRIFARADASHIRSDRVLGPEEDICRTIDHFYPNGQTVDDALVIDVPVRRTPKPSPRPHYGYNAMDDHRPMETGTDYFPPMPVVQPVLPGSIVAHHSSAGQDNGPRSMAVLTTGQLPPIPSPGSTRKYHRPKYGRQHTSSPTIIQHNAAGVPITHRLSTRPRMDSTSSESHQLNGAPPPPPPPALPTPPAPEAAPTGNGTTPPTPSTASTSLNPNRAPRPRKHRKITPEKSLGRRRDRRGSNDSPAALGLPSISSMLDGTVPPINVLLVEDNSINLRVLEGLMKRLRVRWDSAMNGQIAVDKWRKGGYHLILMDIQMPVMNGLQATKEIRRLEKVNGIGVFSGSTPSSPEERRQLKTVNEDGDESTPVVPDKHEADRLPVLEGIFKSPIIIVALTASSLQSDRHEALAAGCNDFLTKPVNMGWLERKVKEWGCMQALIDFDGWKRWRDINEKAEAGKSQEQKQKEREKEELQRVKMDKFAALNERRAAAELEQKKKKAAAAAAAAITPSPVDVTG